MEARAYFTSDNNYFIIIIYLPNIKNSWYHHHRHYFIHSKKLDKLTGMTTEGKQGGQS